MELGIRVSTSDSLSRGIALSEEGGELRDALSRSLLLSGLSRPITPGRLEQWLQVSLLPSRMIFFVVS